MRIQKKEKEKIWFFTDNIESSSDNSEEEEKEDFERNSEWLIMTS